MGFWMQTGMLVALLLNEVLIVINNRVWHMTMPCSGAQQALTVFLLVIDAVLLYLTLMSHVTYFPTWLSVIALVLFSWNSIALLTAHGMQRK